ncbi:MAG: hypothetical protein RIA09_10645 [Hoeflea sp.]
MAGLGDITPHKLQVGSCSSDPRKQGILRRQNADIEIRGIRYIFRSFFKPKRMEFTDPRGSTIGQFKRI